VLAGKGAGVKRVSTGGRLPENAGRFASGIAVMGGFGDIGTYGGVFEDDRGFSNEQSRPLSASAAWLEWLTVHFCREHEYLIERPEWLRDFRVTVVDATKAMGKELYTLHMMIELFSLSVAEQILTDASKGESMTNFQSVQKNDLTLGDRAYGSITGMRWMEEREAYYVFRLKAKAFNLYQRNEKGHYVRFDLTEKLNDWEEGKTLCLNRGKHTSRSEYAPEGSPPRRLKRETRELRRPIPGKSGEKSRNCSRFTTNSSWSSRICRRKSPPKRFWSFTA